MHVREALAAEAELLSELAIQSKAYWGYSEEFIESCKDVLTIDTPYIVENHVYVLEEKLKIVGFFSFERRKGDTLDFLYIHPDFIGRQFGSELWESVLHKARELGIKSFTIDSDPNAKGFYEKMGAKQVGKTPSTVFRDRLLPLMKYVVED
ncbi:GNAT family N-acetyltransferase [Halobacillus shinanisalinarum]|uniref:GNAT family N-acetyltransferase n=1 Tax=Halobacillus shinanisalinarum TaxID=2932258 RepID=A0ABY4H619_9BACI|nr:GNAT family N-acetyltransferase [Halobacillus shinanisalinarum]UOQ95646.1 GNAT family N-acetyltransferase [Halobacillus shinanisalinarum]